MSTPAVPRSIDELLQVMRQLRDPESGCAWDVAQSFASIAPFTIEEAYEVADAIEREDRDDLREELGDLLFQVVFHAQMAEEQDLFAFPDVVGGIVDKLVRRHPHVFADASFESDDALKEHWEAAKAAERRSKRAAAGADSSTVLPSALDGVAANLPALVRAEKIQQRAARVGFDWPSPPPVFDKVAEELDEVREAGREQDAAALHDEIGDLLFAAVNLARHHQVDAENALRSATRKFDRRFRAVEQLALARGLRLDAQDIDSLDALWDEVKRQQDDPR